MKTPEAPSHPTLRGRTLYRPGASPSHSTFSRPVTCTFPRAHFNLKQTLNLTLLTLFNSSNSLISRLCTSFHVNKKGSLCSGLISVASVFSRSMNSVLHPLFPLQMLTFLSQVPDFFVFLRSVCVSASSPTTSLRLVASGLTIPILHSQNPHGTAVFCAVPRNEIFSSRPRRAPCAVPPWRFSENQKSEIKNRKSVYFSLASI